MADPTPPSIQASSGTYNWFPPVGEIIDEAAERAHVDPRTLTLAQQYSARRSLNATLLDFANRDVRLQLVEEDLIPVVHGQQTYTLSDHTFDVLEASLRRNGIDVPMHPISRADYLAIPDKTLQGRPERYYVERLAPVKLHIWLTGENSTDVIVLNALRISQDIKANMMQRPDIARLWIDALMSELAARLHQKWGGTDEKPWDGQYQRYLDAKANESYTTARMQDREYGDLQLVFEGRRRFRHGR